MTFRSLFSFIYWIRLVVTIMLPSVFDLFAPRLIGAEVLATDTVWQGDIRIEEDLLIPHGITLTIAAGTHVIITPSESTKIDPEYLSNLTEITVRGHLEVEGEPDRPVTFSLPPGQEDSQWAGIFIDSGNAWLRHAQISGAETAVYTLQGWVKLKESTLSNNHYGLIVQGDKSGAKVEHSAITENNYGVLTLDGAQVTIDSANIANNRKSNTLERHAQAPPVNERNPVDEKMISHVYEDQTLLGTSIWRGRIVVNGILRIPPESRLLIEPGTIVEFTKKDSNGDGIGENGLLLQGGVIAKGTPSEPIIFRSAETQPGMGDWDAINILGSEGAQNLLEYCRIEDAYRGLHFHFTKVLVNQVTLRNNYRAMQFQESLVTINGCRLFNNRSAVQARDSEIALIDNEIFSNYNGANFFRVTMLANNNLFFNNKRDGIRIREGTVTFEHNQVAGNRFGLLVADTVYGKFNDNILNNNTEVGLSLRNNDNIEVSANIIQYSGINGINIQQSRGDLQNNLISDNAERGLGVQSFSGVLHKNNIVRNGLLAVEIEGEMDVDMSDNWWGTRSVDQLIRDRHDDPTRGEAKITPISTQPWPLTWHHGQISTNVAWHGKIFAPNSIHLAEHASITIAPGAEVQFSPTTEGFGAAN